MRSTLFNPGVPLGHISLLSFFPTFYLPLIFNSVSLSLLLSRLIALLAHEEILYISWPCLTCSFP